MTIRLVGMPAADEPFDHIDDVAHVVSSPRFDIRGKYPERPHIIVIDIRIATGDLIDRDTGLLRSIVDLVVDIGDVPRIGNRVTRPQESRQRIEDDRGSGIADVGMAVDRGATDIHRHSLAIERFEDFLTPGQGVVERNLHAQNQRTVRWNGRL